MAKPVVSSIGVFDATKGTSIHFKIPTSTYGLKEYQYTIKANDGSIETVIATVNGSEFSYNPTTGYEIALSPVDGMINRSRSYYLRLSVMLENEETFGDESNSVVFYCKEKPSLTFESLDMENDNEIHTSSVTFNLIYTYNTEQGEALSSYQYHLYDKNKSLLNESTVHYGSAGTNYVVYGLETKTDYYIRGTGTTKNGYSLDTGYVSLNVTLNIVENRAIIRGDVNPQDGTVKLTSHVVSVDGEASGDVNYIDLGNDNYAVDLTDGTTVSYAVPYENETYRTKEFDLRVVVSPIIGEEIINIKRDVNGTTENVVVSTHVRTITDSDGTASKFYAILKVLGTETTDSTEIKTLYIVYSNYLDCPDPSALGYVLIDIGCSNGLFGISVSKVSDGTEASA